MKVYETMNEYERKTKSMKCNSYYECMKPLMSMKEKQLKSKKSNNYYEREYEISMISLQRAIITMKEHMRP